MVYQDQCEDGIIQDIQVIGIDPFADQCFSVVGQDLAQPLELHQYEVSKTFLAHAPPGFTVIVIFILHQRLCGACLQIEERSHFFHLQFLRILFGELQLHQTDHRVIHNAFELAGDVIRYFLLFLLLDGTDTLRFDIDLVDDGNRTKHPPGGSIIAGFLNKYILTGTNRFIVLLVGIHHYRLFNTLAPKVINKKYMFTLNCRGRILPVTRPLVMGILNTTPDSFFSGSRVNSMETAVEKARQMIADGADILDIGGQSTRPGSKAVSAAEESRRVLPVVVAIRREFPAVFLSIDTYYGEVAETAVDAGADIINDVSGGTIDARILSVAAEKKVPYVLMHSKGNPENMQSLAHYTDVTLEVLDYFIQKTAELKKNGIADIIIDPGFGFAKTPDHNFELLDKLSIFRVLPYPLLAGISRKSMIYKTLNIPVEQALNGTTVLHTIALMQGAVLLRVHDVKAACEAVVLYERVKKRPAS